jgi:hypothetical protein
MRTHHSFVVDFPWRPLRTPQGGIEQNRSCSAFNLSLARAAAVICVAASVLAAFTAAEAGVKGYQHSS